MQRIYLCHVFDQIAPRACPWRSVPANDEHRNASSVMKEAYKYGLRAITKARWNALSEEYLVYKRSLADVARAEPETHRPDQGVPDHGRSEHTARPHPTPKLKHRRRRRPLPPRPTHSTASFSCATSPQARTRLRSNCSLPKRSKTKMEVGKDTNVRARARSLVSITSNLACGWTRCSVPPLSPFFLFAGLKADPGCMLVPPSSRVARLHDAVDRLL